MITFKLGINMAGAVSAGAYTAGVLDFLTEALDAWYAAKASNEVVPSHDVSIEVFSGASAGGMCAAISAVMLGQEFEHVADTSKKGTSNRFYESWVNRIDIAELLKKEDLQGRSPDVISLLDSTIIERIASEALTPSTPLQAPRKYVSPNLTLFLSLTNLRGVPYSLNGAAPGSVEETTFFFGDRIRFEMRSSADNTPLRSKAIHALYADKPGDEGWKTLQTAAMATGAFPVFLAPRILERRCNEYTPPMWESVTSKLDATPPPIPPNFPPGFPPADKSGAPGPMETLNVDGGITNNDPFNYAHDYLASLEPVQDPTAPVHDALSTDRAVISIAPFPTTEKFECEYSAKENSGVLAALPSLFSALVSQSRFFGESLSKVMDGTTFNRFIIAPSDSAMVEKHQQECGEKGPRQRPALQCAALGAFGGFFELGFRRHDYELGRRNCQKFLTNYLLLPAENTVIKEALDALPEDRRRKVLAKYGHPAPTMYAKKRTPGAPEPTTRIEAAKATTVKQAVPVAEQLAASTDNPESSLWLPLIPLVTDELNARLPPVERRKIAPAKLKAIVRLMSHRASSVLCALTTQIPSWPLRVFLRTGLPVITRLVQRPLRHVLIRELGEDYGERGGSAN